MKGRFDDTPQRRTPVAQVNEMLLKVVVHNIVCLVHSTHELDIEPA